MCGCLYKCFIQDLFEAIRSGSISSLGQHASQLQVCELKQCSVSSAREGPFSIVDRYLIVTEVCSQFGSYVKLVCEGSSTIARSSMLVKNAFSVLMNSSQVDELPKRIVAYNKRITSTMT